ncbi:MAG: arginase [Pyrinomonadaceae bacterium]|nr:arginase [Pyrinomonadaceae bacterium]MCX7639914.1 arginase [Pyrinomonadaceae bacterium]MDW8304086.1 arginase [Acidobacteriota bacterium]
MKNVGLIGIPLGFAASKPGSEFGAAAIRKADIRGKRLVEHIAELGYQVKDYGDVEIVNPNYIATKEESPKYLKEMNLSCLQIVEAMREILAKGDFPVILGGDHSIAIGTFSSVSDFYRRDQGKQIGLIWFDAHADMNTPETSPSGNLHGMPLAVLLGFGEESLTNLCGYSPKLNPEFLAHIGGRDLDPGEKELIYKLGLRDHFFTMSDIDRHGMAYCVEKAIEIVSKASGGYSVTFDIDIIDPRFAPGSGTLVRGGITYREAHLALEIIAEAGGMLSFEMVEVNPTLDKENITVELAGELILSALGKVIL